MTATIDNFAIATFAQYLPIATSLLAIADFQGAHANLLTLFPGGPAGVTLPKTIIRETHQNLRAPKTTPNNTIGLSENANTDRGVPPFVRRGECLIVEIHVGGEDPDAEVLNPCPISQMEADATGLF